MYYSLFGMRIGSLCQQPAGASPVPARQLLFLPAKTVATLALMQQIDGRQAARLLGQGLLQGIRDKARRMKQSNSSRLRKAIAAFLISGSKDVPLTALAPPDQAGPALICRSA